MTNLRQLAEVTGVQFEWLATGRGGMALLMDARDAVAAADALLIEDDLEMRLIRAFRDMPVKSKVPVAEIVEQLAVGRMGVKRR